MFIRKHYITLDEAKSLLVDVDRFPQVMLQSVQFNTRFFISNPCFHFRPGVAKVVCLSQAKSHLVGCLRILVTKAFIKARYIVMLSSQMLSLWLYTFTIYGSFLNFKVIFMKFCKKLNYFCCFIVAQALRNIQPLCNAPMGEGDSGFCYEAGLGGGGGLKWYRYVTLYSRATDCFFSRQEKLHEQCQLL